MPMDESKKNMVFVINPIAGTRSKRFIFELLNRFTDKEKFSWEAIKTKRAGDAVNIANQAVQEGVDMVVAVGGDGTVNEVARSLVHTSTALGIIPYGSGNGLARHLQIPLEPQRAIEVLNEEIIDTIDYGKINGIPFFCTCGLGFDAFVSLKFSNAGKRGMLTYMEKALREYLTYQPETYKLKTEEHEVTYKAFLLACGNASQYGNNAYIAPHATVTDGLLDVTILEPFTIPDVPTLAFQLFNKTLDQNSLIKTFQCRKLYIFREKAGVIHFDGEPVMSHKEVEIEVVRQSLRVVVPAYEKMNLNVLQKASDYFMELKTMNELIVENLVRKNKLMLKKNKSLIKRFMER
ncbi:putative lipid kinase YegS [termite gut metagenome]|uniref:Putative lipid kinase YegS n=1 Tax=termite gut metagenome TaxID=433724 RepID=A0A5J4R198_9ZZZZ